MTTAAEEKYYEIYGKVIKKYPGLAPRRFEFEPAFWLDGDGPTPSRHERVKLIVTRELEKELLRVVSAILTKRRNG